MDMIVEYVSKKSQRDAVCFVCTGCSRHFLKLTQTKTVLAHLIKVDHNRPLRQLTTKS